MSLPIPSSSGPASTLDPKQLQALDGPLIALTQQCGGDLRRLMFAYFSFLHRRTDFYLVPHPDDIQAGKPASMGFEEGDAEKLLIAAFRQFPLRRIPKGQGGGQATPTPSTAKTSSKTPGTKGAPPAPVKESVKSTPAPSMIATTEASAGTEESEKSSEKKGVSKNSTGNMADVRYNEEGLQIPVGNGGSTKEYKWTQTIEECSVLVGVPKDLRGKDLLRKRHGVPSPAIILRHRRRCTWPSVLKQVVSWMHCGRRGCW